MKLAEALVERKGLKEKLARLRARLADNAKVQEGDAPTEAPEELLAEVDRVLRDLERLIVRINRTNITTRMPGNPEATVMEAIARRDMLNLKRQVLEQVAGEATVTRGRTGWGVTRNEVKFEPTVDLAGLQRQIDALAKAYRELDTEIQAVNWATDLAE